MDLGLWFGLATTAFLAGSILPFPSEAALAGAILHAPEQMIGLVVAAAVGNVAGASLNWWLGLWLENFKDRLWFPVTTDQLDRAQQQYRRFGLYSLLLAWLPIIGDPLTIIAGIMRVPFGLFLLLVGVAKLGRYLIVASLIV